MELPESNLAETNHAFITSAVLGLLSRRESAASVCPSEIARALSGDEWRPLMPRIREVLVELITQQLVIATRGGRVLESDELLGGPIRIRRGRNFPGGWSP